MPGRPLLSRLGLTWLALAISVAAHSDDTLRCGSRLVSVGDGKDKVRSLCGEPTDVAFAGTVGRRGYPYYTNNDAYDYSYFGPTWVEMPVEIWTYNLGSHKLLRKLRFVGDELVEIRTDGYGY
jgi:Protein of unknown function (DUF2845)